MVTDPAGGVNRLDGKNGTGVVRPQAGQFRRRINAIPMRELSGRPNEAAESQPPRPGMPRPRHGPTRLVTDVGGRGVAPLVAPLVPPIRRPAEFAAEFGQVA